MRKLVWLDSVVNDVARLRKFIVKENPNVAKCAAEAIKDTANRLIKMPSIGKPVQTLTGI